MTRIQRISESDGIALLRRREAELNFRLPELAIERFRAVYFGSKGASADQEKLKIGLEVLFEVNMTAEDRERVNVLLLDLPAQEVIKATLGGIGAAIAVGDLSEETGRYAVERLRHNLQLRKMQDDEAEIAHDAAGPGQRPK